VSQLISKEFILEGESAQKPITADIKYKDNDSSKPLIILAHGFKGFKDWGPWHILSEKAAVDGFCFCKFNFSWNGITPAKKDEISDLEAFGHNNFSKEAEDIDRLLNYLKQPEIAEQYQIDTNQIFLIGHSRGGGISIIKTAEDNRIKKLVTWASVSDFESHLSDKEFLYWETQGVIYVKNSRTGEQFPMYYQFAEDFLNSGNRFILSKAIKDMDQPLLIIHGTEDETVNVNAAFQLKDWKKDAELLIIDKASHTFGAKHPYLENEIPKDLAKAFSKTLEFFKS